MFAKSFYKCLFAGYFVAVPRFNTLKTSLCFALITSQTHSFKISCPHLNITLDIGAISYKWITILPLLVSYISNAINSSLIKQNNQLIRSYLMSAPTFHTSHFINCTLINQSFQMLGHALIAKPMLVATHKCIMTKAAHSDFFFITYFTKFIL